jgi:hypothetical protein
VQRIKRVKERCSDLLGDNGWRWRVLRTSNSYTFSEPCAAYGSSKSDFPTGTPNQVFFSSMGSRPLTAQAEKRAFEGAIDRFGA